MKTLIHYEKLKLSKRKSGKIAVVLMLLCIAVLNILFVSEQMAYRPDGTEIYGIEAIQKNKEYDHALAGTLTPDRIKDAVHHYQAIYGDPTNYVEGTDYIRNDVYINEIYPCRRLLVFLAEVFSPAQTYDFYVLDSVTDEMIDDFYQTRQSKIQTLLDSSGAGGSFSQVEKDRITEWASEVEEPFTFDHTRGWVTLLIRSFQITFVLASLVVCIILSPTFSYEYQTGADSVVMSSKYGRRETALAKIIAGGIVTSRIYLLTAAFSIGLTLACFGVYGWNCEFQLLSLTSFHALKIWQVVLYGVLINYLVIIAVMAFTMLLSALCKTPFVTVIISSLCLVAPMLVPSVANPLINRLISLLPARAMDTYNVFSAYVVYPFGKTVISLPCMIVMLSFVMILIMLTITRHRYCRHQVV